MIPGTYILYFEYAYVKMNWFETWGELTFLLKWGIYIVKGLFIINPSSGRQNFQDKIQDIAGKLIMDQICNTIDVFYTEKQDDALNRAAELQKGEYDFVVSVGGDGTLNEVINGIMLSGSEIPVAAISAGTVNDFATYLELPQDVGDFCRMIQDYQTKEVDVGKVDGKYFINVLAAGIFSDIGFRVTKDKKAAMGKLAYYLEGATAIPEQLGNSFRFFLWWRIPKVWEDSVRLRRWLRYQTACWISLYLKRQIFSRFCRC